jgi:DNA-binding SARP family transcriptional activator
MRTAEIGTSGVTRLRDGGAPGAGARRTDEPPPGRTHGDSVLTTRPSGYVLRLDSHELDLISFREHASLGRAALASGDHSRAETHFAAALCQWYGSPLADLHQVGVLARYAARLDEERVQLTHDWANAMISLGNGAQVVGQLDELCTSYPLRERFHHLLMLALYQADRRAEALAAYSRAYRLLTQEVGIEPSLRLRDAHRELLGDESPLPISRWADLVATT